MIKQFSILTPNPRGEKIQLKLAGLLTYSRLDAFPAPKTSGNAECFKTLIGASQQRDCSGFSPDSLLLPFTECKKANQFGGKDKQDYNIIRRFCKIFSETNRPTLM